VALRPTLRHSWNSISGRAPSIDGRVMIILDWPRRMITPEKLFSTPGGRVHESQKREMATKYLDSTFKSLSPPWSWTKSEARYPGPYTESQMKRKIARVLEFSHPYFYPTFESRRGRVDLVREPENTKLRHDLVHPALTVWSGCTKISRRMPECGVILASLGLLTGGGDIAHPFQKREAF